MEIFSEIYNCYYSVVSSILQQSPLTKKQIDEYIMNQAFLESSIILTPKLCNENQWGLLHKDSNNMYVSKLDNKPYSPITLLEKSWIKSLLLDERFRLFLSDSTILLLEHQLKDITPLFEKSNFYYFDQFSNGDDFSNSNYKKNFSIILQAIQEKRLLNIHYKTSKNNNVVGIFQPLRLEYSIKNDKFRLFSAKISSSNDYNYYVLNLSRIVSIQNSNDIWNPNITVEKFFEHNISDEPIVVKILEERNAIERFMMEFACYKKYTEYDSLKGIVTAKIWYDKYNETELLIRLLSFGPVLEILSPKHIRKEAKERISAQYRLFFSSENPIEV